MSSLLPGKHRVVTAIILVLVAAGMMTGGGRVALNGYESLSKADRLAAVALLLSGADRDALPVTLLDVDDQTRQAWGAQGVTPHGALAALVRVAQVTGVRGILLDFDLSADGPAATPEAGMSALLRNYPVTAPPLMLVRRISFAGTSATAVAASPYDAEVAGKPNILWVSTLNEASSDRMVRRIRLWQSVCDGASGVAYPSVALAAAAAILDGGRNLAFLQAFLDGRVAADCGKADAPLPAWPVSARQSVQLPFAFGDDTSSPARLRIEANGKQTVALRRISAALLVKYDGRTAEPAGDVDRDPFEGRVVVIGGSFSDSRDIYQTPLGLMPGAVVLANSIVQARAITETAPASSFVQSLLALELFLIFAVVARYFTLPVAILGIGAASVAAVWALSRVFGFESGFEIVAMALTGFALFRLVDAVVQMVLDFPAKGWRAILKS